MRYVPLALAAGFMLSACAGRAPQLVATVQVYDQQRDCLAINAEIAANAQQVSRLAVEESDKRTQNIVAGTVGMVLFFPALLAMDFQDAAGKETLALTNRNSYLAVLAAQKRCIG